MFALQSHFTGKKHLAKWLELKATKQPEVLLIDDVSTKARQKTPQPRSKPPTPDAAKRAEKPKAEAAKAGGKAAEVRADRAVSKAISTAAEQLNGQKAGSKSRAAMEASTAWQPLRKLSSESATSQDSLEQQLALKTSAHWCAFCKKNYRSTEELTAHQLTPIHAESVTAAYETNELGGRSLPHHLADLAWRCHLCGVNTTSATTLKVSHHGGTAFEDPCLTIYPTWPSP